MTDLLPILAFVAGALVTGGALYLARRGGRREIEARLRQATEEAVALRGRLQEEGERRSAAEERAARIGSLEQQVAQREESLAALHAKSAEQQAEISRLVTQLEGERKALEEQGKLLAEAKASLTDTFRALSSEALSQSNRSFLELARETLERYQVEARGELDKKRVAVEQLVSPIRESLNRVDQQIQEMERSRHQSQISMSEQVRQLVQTQDRLQTETQRLAQALRTPNVRGRWGEIQLRRVVEIAGMIEYCDFLEQASVGDDTARLRPDLLVLLPGGKTVVVDAKAPLKAYLDAQEVEGEEARRQHLANHARHIRKHLGDLSSKGYWEQFEQTPEFVVMFLPGESFFSAALEQDPALIEEGVKQRVILATPTTLIALLRAVSYGWRQERLAEGAQAISQLGRELYERLRTLAEHVDKLGTHLQRAVASYNQTVGSLESRVLVSARRFGELGVGTGKEIPQLGALEASSRSLQGADWEEPEEESRPSVPKPTSDEDPEVV